MICYPLLSQYSSSFDASKVAYFLRQSASHPIIYYGIIPMLGPVSSIQRRVNKANSFLLQISSKIFFFWLLAMIIQGCLSVPLLISVHIAIDLFVYQSVCWSVCWSKFYFVCAEKSRQSTNTPPCRFLSFLLFQHKLTPNIKEFLHFPS